MRKADTLKHWRALEPTDPLPVMTPISTGTRGSRYGCCGIRIDGSPAFVDAVLSQLTSLIDGENQVTRLELARSTVQRKPGYNAGMNADTDAEVCYIRLHMRSAQGSAASAFFDKDLNPATERYAAAMGA